MFVAINTGWQVEYIYQFDIDDFHKTLESILRLQGKVEAKKNTVSPSEFIKTLK